MLYLQDLSYTYPDGTVALRGVSVAIAVGERVALVGANGSGKSTLIAHLNGLLLPQVGGVRVGELPVVPENLTKIRNRVGVVFQNPEDQLFMTTVWEDVAFGPMNQGVRGEALQQRVQGALWAVGLDPAVVGSKLPQNLSGGQQKRVAIAGVLAMNPEVLVLDEPSAQLDPRARRQLIELLRTLPQTKVIATHDLDLALGVCDRTLVLDRGDLVGDGPTAQILGDEAFLLAHGLELPLSLSRK